MKTEALPLQPAPPLPATSRPKFESPATAVFCWIIGWFALIVGLVMVFAAFATAFGLSHPNDTGGDPCRLRSRFASARFFGSRSRRSSKRSPRSRTTRGAVMLSRRNDAVAISNAKEYKLTRVEKMRLTKR